MALAADPGRSRTALKQELARAIDRAVNDALKDPQGESAPLTKARIAKEISVDPRSLARYRDGSRLPELNAIQRLETFCQLEPGALTGLREAIDDLPPDELDETRRGRRDAPRSVRPGGPVGRKTALAKLRSLPALIVLLTVVGVVLVGAIVVVAISAGGDDSSSAGGVSPSSSTPTLAAQPPASARIEIADVRAGIQLYKDNRGTGADAANLPMGTRVSVACMATDLSGIASINAFYLIKTEPWRGLFASANQFANGAPVGVTTNADPMDPAVPRCKSS